MMDECSECVFDTDDVIDVNCFCCDSLFMQTNPDKFAAGILHEIDSVSVSGVNNFVGPLSMGISNKLPAFVVSFLVFIAELGNLSKSREHTSQELH
jgi:hypothetical protein